MFIACQCSNPVCKTDGCRYYARTRQVLGDITKAVALQASPVFIGGMTPAIPKPRIRVKAVQERIET